MQYADPIKRDLQRKANVHANSSNDELNNGILQLKAMLANKNQEQTPLSYFQEALNNSERVQQATQMKENIANNPHAKKMVTFQRMMNNKTVQHQPYAEPIQMQANQPVIQFAIEDDLEAMKEFASTTDDPLLRNIINEVLEMTSSKKTDIKYGRSKQQSHADRGKTEGTYEAVIDDEIWTDDTQREAIILHELLHGSADEKYNINEWGSTKMNNLVKGDTERAEVQHRGEASMDLYDIIVKEKKLFKENVYDYLLSRAERAAGSPIQEFDTAISELFYYAKKSGEVSEDTETYKKIRELSEGAYKSRNEGTPLLAPPIEPKKSCFITTACVTSMGLPDDCDELTTLRHFRDDYLRRREEGEEWIQLYYKIAPTIVKAINSRKNAAEIYNQIYKIIRECVELIKHQENEAALEIYKIMVIRLKDKY